MSADPLSTEARARGALLGTFVGDALGMPFEGAGPAAVPERLEMIEARLGRGTYTDDTEMMTALAECLVESGSIDPEALARRFLAHHDPRRGYGAGTMQVFAHWRRGVPVADAARLIFGGQGSLGNGAAMRIAPVGVRFADDPERLDEEARRSAALTHAHPQGVDAAAAQAAAVGAAMRGDPVLEAASAAVATGELRDRLAIVEELVGGPPPAPEAAAARLGTSSAGFESVPAAIHAALIGEDVRSAITFAIRCGGDTDTIGAMAGAIAGGRHGVDAIPSSWLDPLEDGPRGRSHVERLATALVQEEVGG